MLSLEDLDEKLYQQRCVHFDNFFRYKQASPSYIDRVEKSEKWVDAYDILLGYITQYSFQMKQPPYTCPHCGKAVSLERIKERCSPFCQKCEDLIAYEMLPRKNC